MGKRILEENKLEWGRAKMLRPIFEKYLQTIFDSFIWLDGFYCAQSFAIFDCLDCIVCNPAQKILGISFGRFGGPKFIKFWLLFAPWLGGLFRPFSFVFWPFTFSNAGPLAKKGLADWPQFWALFWGLYNQIGPCNQLLQSSPRPHLKRISIFNLSNNLINIVVNRNKKA